MRSLIAAAILAATMLATPSFADEPLVPPAAASTPHQPPSAADMQKMMSAAMSGMVPVMGHMTEAMIEAQLSSAAQPQTAERIAAFKRNLYDALIKKGFAKSEALQIVIATGIPTATPTSK